MKKFGVKLRGFPLYLKMGFLSDSNHVNPGKTEKVKLTQHRRKGVKDLTFD
jgi:hypothetical protein